MSHVRQEAETIDIHSTIRKSLDTYWRVLLIEGILLVVLGIAAILVPVVASLAVSVSLGVLFLIGGIAGLITTFIGRHAPGFFWSLLSALAAIAAGVLLVGWPVAGAVSLTFVLTAFLFADGLFMIGLGIAHRNEQSRQSVWLIVNGILDLLLAAFILWLLPEGAIWIVGLIVGIDMLFGGSSLIAMALAGRKATDIAR